MKDLSIQFLVERLDLPSRGWTIVDNWDADLCAIGIASSDHTKRRVYISTFEKGPERYHYECEILPAPDADHYVTTNRGEDVDFESLLGVLTAHLSST